MNVWERLIDWVGLRSVDEDELEEAIAKAAAAEIKLALEQEEHRKTKMQLAMVQRQQAGDLQVVEKLRRELAGERRLTMAYEHLLGPERREELQRLERAVDAVFEAMKLEPPKDQAA